MARPKLGSALSVAILAGATGAAAPHRQSFDLAVPWPPQLVTVDGKDQLVYELHVTNFSQEPLTLRSLQVRGDRVLARLAGADLARHMSIVRPAGADPSAAPLAPGARAIIYLEIECRRGAA